MLQKYDLQVQPAVWQLFASDFQMTLTDKVQATLAMQRQSFWKLLMDKSASSRLFSAYCRAKCSWNTLKHQCEHHYLQSETKIWPSCQATNFDKFYGDWIKLDDTPGVQKKWTFTTAFWSPSKTASWDGNEGWPCSLVVAISILDLYQYL